MKRSCVEDGINNNMDSPKMIETEPQHHKRVLSQESMKDVFNITKIHQLLQCSEVGRDPSTLVLPWLQFTLSITQNVDVEDKRYIYDMVSLPAGEIVFATDNEINLYQDNKLQRSFYGHTSHIRSLTLLPSGEIASGSYDKTVKIWNPTDGNCLHTLEQGSIVFSLCTLPNGDLVCGLQNGTINIWRNFRLIHTLHEHHIFAIRCLCACPPRYDFASGSDDKKIRLWKDGQCQNVLEGHISPIQTITVLSNGYLLSGDLMGTIKRWNKDGICVTRIQIDNDNLTNIIALPNGYWLSSSYDILSDNRQLQLWNDQQVCLKTLPIHCRIMRRISDSNFQLVVVYGRTIATLNI